MVTSVKLCSLHKSSMSRKKLAWCSCHWSIYIGLEAVEAMFFLCEKLDVRDGGFLALLDPTWTEPCACALTPCTTKEATGALKSLRTAA